MEIKSTTVKQMAQRCSVAGYMSPVDLLHVNLQDLVRCDGWLCSVLGTTRAVPPSENPSATVATTYAFISYDSV